MDAASLLAATPGEVALGIACMLITGLCMFA